MKSTFPTLRMARVSYPVTIFLSAFLLLQLQPIIGKLILPAFGGGPSVWACCMFFFQFMLLAGYTYAHLLASVKNVRRQRTIHVTLLLASLCFLPLDSNPAGWAAAESTRPVIALLSLLVTRVGLPFFLLSASAPLLQETYRRQTAAIPYGLYSLSNIGSLMALLTYPFVLEPQLTLGTQLAFWSGGYLLFTFGCAWCVAFVVDTSATSDEPYLREAVSSLEHAEPPTVSAALFWLSLSACGSIMLLATTNQMCRDVTSMPFLWIVPLAIYLLSFVICFGRERWYRRKTFLQLLVVGTALAGVAIVEGHALTTVQQFSIYAAVLWICCMVCHGELARTKPAPRYLTWFYLLVAAGGAVGGFAVAVAAPLILPDFWEYQIGLVATVLLAFVSALPDFISRPTLRRVSLVAVSAAAIIALVWSIHVVDAPQANTERIGRSRNFYGVLRVHLVDDSTDTNGPRRELLHGHITHGYQYVDAEKRRWPVSYYGRQSGIGLAIERHPRRNSQHPDVTPLRIGVIGLGCGTLAAYGRPGDSIRFYEIDPEVLRVSEEFFSYRADCQATVDVVLGDASIELARELAAGTPQGFDVLAVDAFSSDSIPMHLLTKQAVDLFRKHLRPDGLLCFHISNRYLDLTPVMVGVAEATGCKCAFIYSESDVASGTLPATWAIVTQNAVFLAAPEVQRHIVPWDSQGREPIVWTNDYGSLWHVLKN